MQIYEPEAEIAREIFRACVEDGRSIRQVAHDPHDLGIGSPTGKPVWAPRRCSDCCTTRPTSAASTTTAARRSTTPTHPAARGARRRATARNGSRSRCRRSSTRTLSSAPKGPPREPRWNPRGAEPGHRPLRGLIDCGCCQVDLSARREGDQGRLLRRPGSPRARAAVTPCSAVLAGSPGGPLAGLRSL
jgi:hypothetical protein